MFERAVADASPEAGQLNRGLDRALFGVGRVIPRTFGRFLAYNYPPTIYLWLFYCRHSSFLKKLFQPSNAFYVISIMLTIYNILFFIFL